MGILCWACKDPCGYCALVGRRVLLQFADDSVVLAPSPEEIQSVTNFMAAYHGDYDNDDEEISSDDNDDHVGTCENDDQ